ncbi:MAG TPA: hypothetical protein VEG39_01855 [Clostridia bacterium]|nr:hypothetical protein [Clostridia bacterium]
MKNILLFLWEWRFIIILVIAAGLYCLLEWEKAKKMIYAGIAQAKRYAKDQVLKNGAQQEEYVVKLMLEKLPLSLRIFMGEDMIRYLVKKLYGKLCDYIDNGALDDSFKIE